MNRSQSSLEIFGLQATWSGFGLETLLWSKILVLSSEPYKSVSDRIQPFNTENWFGPVIFNVHVVRGYLF